MTRFTVTGAGGFIGKKLVSHLHSLGHGVLAMVRGEPASYQFDDGVEVIRGDVRDPETLTGRFADCDVMIHLAGCTIARRRRDFEQVNHRGTENVASACLAQPVTPKLLYVSSVAAAGPSPDGHAWNESDVAHPVSDYGRSKLAAEQSLRQLGGQMKVQIVRPSSVFGDTDRYLLSLFKAAKSGWVVVPGRRAANYSFIHVDDLVRSLHHVAMRETASTAVESFYLAQDPPLSFPQIAQTISEALDNGPVRAFHAPASLCWTIAAANSACGRLFATRPLLNLDKIREGLAGSWVCDPSRLRDETGFQFQVSLHDRIRQTALAYRKLGLL